MPVFLSQKAHIQGVEAPRRSHSTVKLRNAEDELSEAKPGWDGHLRSSAQSSASPVWIDQNEFLIRRLRQANSPSRAKAII